MMRRELRLVGAASLFFVVASGPATAFGGCGPHASECYTKTRAPDVYATVEQPVILHPGHREVVTTPPLIGLRHTRVAVSPARVHTHYSPAVYATVSKPVLVEPARVTYAHAPAVYRSVHETVVVRPAGVAWQRSHDHHGRETLCKVRTAAVVQTVSRRVMIAPPQRIAHHAPAVYREVNRTVLVRPAATHHSYQPAVHQWVAQPYVARPAVAHIVQHPPVIAVERRHVLVKQGGYSWQPTGHRWH